MSLKTSQIYVYTVESVFRVGTILCAHAQINKTIESVRLTAGRTSAGALSCPARLVWIMSGIGTGRGTRSSARLRTVPLL